MQSQPLSHDLLPLAVELWNRALGTSFPMRPELLNQNLWSEPNFDPEGSRAVLKGDKMIGMIAVKRQQVEIGNQPANKRGWISALIVDPEEQGKGIGTALLQGALTHLAQFSKEPVSLGADTGNFFPGIPMECRQALDWFARRGASLGGLACDLASFSIASYTHPEEAERAFAKAPGVVYRPATLEDADAIHAFMKQEFPGRWAWEMEQHFAKGGQPEDVMIALDEGRVVGFARVHGHWSKRFGPGIYWAPLFPGQHGGMGPIGVGADQRGRGIGLGLLSEAIATLRERGSESAVIDWTGLVQLYGLVGFRPWKWYIAASFKPKA